MANKSTKVRGITIELGGDASPLNDALKGVNKQLNSTQSELKDIERLLKLDPGNTELLEQKQRKLAESIENTTEKLNALQEAEKHVQQQMSMGQADQKQYDALQREIIETELKLKNLEDQAKESASALDKIAERSSKIATGAQNISDTFQPVTTAVAGLGAAAIATVPATEELREDLSKLDQNAIENSVSIDKARKAWKLFAVQSGETDSAVEAVSNLLQAGFSESNLQKAVEGLAGAAQRFPDTLKVESLADSLQETLASGAATGQFAELLDRLGVSAESFSEKLAACRTESEKQNLVLKTLAEEGLNASYEAWAENNEEMLANKQANLELQESMAELAEVVMPFVTAFTEKAAELISWFANLDTGTQTLVATILTLLAAISPVASIVSNIAALVPTLATAFGALGPVFTTVGGTAKTAWGILAAHPLVAIIAAAALFGDEIQAILQKVDDFMQGVFAKDWTEVFGSVLGEAMNNFMSNLKSVWDDGMQILNGIIDFIRGVFTADWGRAWEGVYNTFEGIFNGILDLASFIIDSVWGLISSAWDGLKNLWSNASSSKSSQSPSSINSGYNPYMADGGILNSGTAVVGEAGPELLTMLGNGRAQITPLTSKTSNTNNYGGGVTVIVYGTGTQDQAREFGQTIGEETARTLRGKGVTV